MQGHSIQFYGIIKASKDKGEQQMPWKDKTVEEIRKEFAEAAERRENFSAICREYGITRATGYKWLKRYQEEEPMHDRSRRPNIISNKTPEELEQKIFETILFIITLLYFILLHSANLEKACLHVGIVLRIIAIDSGKTSLNLTSNTIKSFSITGTVSKL